MRTWLSLALVLATAPAAALDPRVPLAEVAVETWNRQRGLPTDHVTVMARTGDGTVWLGTDVGLLALDGVSVTHFTTATEPQLPGNAITALAAEGDRLWIGTPRGLGSWHAGVFARNPDDGLPSGGVATIYVGRSGNMWVATRQGLYVRRGERFALTFGGQPNSDGEICPSLVELPDGSLLGACAGVRRFFPEDMQERTLRLPVDSVVLAPDGAVWVGLREGGVYALEGDQRQPIVAREDVTDTLFVDRQGALWVGGRGNGVQRRAPDGRVESLVLPGGVVPSAVFTILEDDDGAILLVTRNVGLVRLRDTAFRTLDDRSGGAADVSSLFEDRAGRLWVGTQGADAALTVFPAKGASGAAPAATRKIPVGALTHLEARDGTHYAGTPSGLVRIVGDRAEPVPLDRELTVGDLVETADGALWIGGYRDGLFRRKGDVVAPIHRPSGEIIETVAMTLSRDGKTLWVGTVHDLCRIDGVERGPGEPPVCIGLAAGVPDAMILSLYEDVTGTLWAGTYEEGLVRVRDGRAVALRGHGLPFDSFYTVFEDAAGRLWMSGPTGVARVARAELEALAERRVTTVAARLFGVADGLPIDETTGGFMSGCQARDGRLWFATPRGAVVVDPGAPDRVATSPASTITELRAGAVGLPRAGGEVPPAGRDLLVRFTAPTLERAAEVRFRYRLDGVDDDWIDAGARRLAIYNDVPPGEHTFRVAAMAAGASAWGLEATSALAVSATFTETLVFKLLLVALALALLYLGHRLRVAGLEARERRLGALVAARTHELASAKSELEALNTNLAERVAETVAALRSSERMAAYGHTVAGVAHEVRQPLFALGTAAYVLTDKLRDRPELEREVKVLDRETRRMNRVMDELLEFAKPRGLARAVTSVAALVRDSIEVFRAEHDPDGRVPITVDIGAGLPEVHVDAERMTQVLVNLFTNAKKHAAGMTRLALRASTDGAAVVIEVDDDGSGIAPADLPHIFDPFVTTGGTGLGLAIARRIVEEHGGAVDVRTSERGTVFRVALPSNEVTHG